MSKPRTTPIGKRNIVGTKIVQLRKARGMKQKDLVIRLQNMGMEGPMGFFEAADFSEKQHGFQIVRSHMSSHQGMILATLCNVLCDQYIARLFSDLPCVQAYRLLLQEKPGRLRGAVRRPLRRRARAEAEVSAVASREGRVLCFPIDAHVLGGGGSTWLIDAQGGGYLARNGRMLTRFHEDCTLPSGPRLYLRDGQSGSFRDLCIPSVSESIRFETAQAVFSNEFFQIKTTLRLFVNPLDGAFLHHLTLENQEDTDRALEIASYLDKAYKGKRKGIFLANDTYANMFLNSLIRSYGSLPEDYQIIGFDNSPISNEAVIPTSTVGQQIDKIAETAMEILVEQMNERKKRKPVILTTPVHKVITPILINRNTTCIVK
mgnify:CR=1 FL=1